MIIFKRNFLIYSLVLLSSFFVCIGNYGTPWYEMSDDEIREIFKEPLDPKNDPAVLLMQINNAEDKDQIIDGIIAESRCSIGEYRNFIAIRCFMRCEFLSVLRSKNINDIADKLEELARNLAAFDNELSLYERRRTISFA